MFVLLLYRIVLMQAKAGEKRETRGDTLKREKRGRVISPLSSSFLQTKGNQSVLLFLRLADVDTVTIKKVKERRSMASPSMHSPRASGPCHGPRTKTVDPSTEPP